MVYDKVLNFYTYSDIDAHKSDRKHHWCGSDHWKHPALQSEEMARQSDGSYNPTGKHKPLSLFPGCLVHPAGTSQTCSKCKRNPIRLLNAEEFKKVKFSIDKNGEVKLPGGEVLVLLSRKDQRKNEQEQHREAKLNRKRKISAPFIYPESSRRVNNKDLITLVKRQLRQPQGSTRSKDTTQSRYEL